VALFEKLTSRGWNLPGLAEPTNLLEGYPGAAWKRLSKDRLPNKSTIRGREARTTVLANAGLQGLTLAPPPTHDQLDAGLLALLGWMFIDPKSFSVSSIILVGEPVFRDSQGVLREGQIVMPAGQAPSRQLSPALVPPDKTASDFDWVYFATAKGTSRDETRQLILQEEVLVRKAHKKDETFNSNVQSVRPGDRILLVYAKRAEFLLEVVAPDAMLAGTLAATKLDDLAHRIRAAGYDDEFIDVVTKTFTGFLVHPIDCDFLGATVQRAGGGMNALVKASGVEVS